MPAGEHRPGATSLERALARPLPPPPRSRHCAPMHPRHLSSALAALALLAACAAEPEPEPLPTLDPPAEGEGFQFHLGGVTVEPGEEVWWCSVFPADLGTPQNVHSVHYLQNEGMHHMTLSGVLPGGPELAEGQYDCAEIYGQEAVMEDAIMIFGGTGTGEDEMFLPDGVVATLPASFDVIHEVHYVNATSEPVEIFSYLNAYTIGDEEVTDRIYGGSVRDEHIVIPPATTHTEWTRCVFNRDVRVHFLAAHTHDLGDTFSIRRWDGAVLGDEVFYNDDLHTPGITQYDPPLEFAEGEGLEWTCTWDNPQDHEVVYGLASTDEMCNMAVVFAPFDLTAACEVVESSDGVLWDGGR